MMFRIKVFKSMGEYNLAMDEVNSALESDSSQPKVGILFVLFSLQDCKSKGMFHFKEPDKCWSFRGVFFSHKLF